MHTMIWKSLNFGLVSIEPFFSLDVLVWVKSPFGSLLSFQLKNKPVWVHEMALQKTVWSATKGNDKN